MVPVLKEAQLARAAAENAQRQVALLQDIIKSQVSTVLEVAES